VGSRGGSGNAKATAQAPAILAPAVYQFEKLPRSLAALKTLPGSPFSIAHPMTLALTGSKTTDSVITRMPVKRLRPRSGYPEFGLTAIDWESTPHAI
jgi:hypothetical protein